MISIFGLGKCKISIFGLWRSTREANDLSAIVCGAGQKSRRFKYEKQYGTDN